MAWQMITPPQNLICVVDLLSADVSEASPRHKAPSGDSADDVSAVQEFDVEDVNKRKLTLTGKGYPPVCYS